MLTAETITDDQIAHLLARGTLTAIEAADCEHALMKRNGTWTRHQRNMQHAARARCADILNARQGA